MTAVLCPVGVAEGDVSTSFILGGNACRSSTGDGNGAGAAIMGGMMDFGSGRGTATGRFPLNEEDGTDAGRLVSESWAGIGKFACGGGNRNEGILDGTGAGKGAGATGTLITGAGAHGDGFWDVCGGAGLGGGDVSAMGC